MGVLACFCALLLLGSATHKILSQERMLGAVRQLTGTTTVTALLLLVMAGVVEIFAGAALLIAPLQVVGSVAAALLWTGYALALARRLGRSVDCGCDLIAKAKPVDAAAVARPALLAVVAVLTLFSSERAWSLETPFAAVALLALYIGASELLAIPRPHWRHA